MINIWCIKYSGQSLFLILVKECLLTPQKSFCRDPESHPFSSCAIFTQNSSQRLKDMNYSKVHVFVQSSQFIISVFLLSIVFCYSENWDSDTFLLVTVTCIFPFGKYWYNGVEEILFLIPWESKISLTFPDRTVFSVLVEDAEKGARMGLYNGNKSQKVGEKNVAKINIIEV